MPRRAPRVWGWPGPGLPSWPGCCCPGCLVGCHPGPRLVQGLAGRPWAALDRLGPGRRSVGKGARPQTAQVGPCPILSDTGDYRPQSVRRGLTGPPGCGTLSLLVAQQRLTPATTILVTPWQGARQPPRQVTDRIGPGPPAALPAGGLVFFPGFSRTSPRPGGAPGRGVLHSRAVATVARWQQPGRANGEEWAPHAEIGLGDDDTPGSQPGGGAPVSGQSCSPPRRSTGERCWRSAAPWETRGRPLQLPEVQGRTWANEGR